MRLDLSIGRVLGVTRQERVTREAAFQSDVGDTTPSVVVRLLENAVTGEHFSRASLRVECRGCRRDVVGGVDLIAGPVIGSERPDVRLRPRKVGDGFCRNGSAKRIERDDSPRAARARRDDLSLRELRVIDRLGTRRTEL